jgi:hypothetical protein
MTKRKIRLSARLLYFLQAVSSLILFSLKHLSSTGGDTMSKVYAALKEV